MTPLEGKELEGKFGEPGKEFGSYSVDVTDKGAVTATVTVDKDFGYGKVSLTSALETDIFKIAEAIAAKTTATWDDAAIATIKKLLGLTPA